ncbi:hypothetical protein AB4Y67_04760 [Arthrobacter sp. YAF17]|uniref:hypothetical protein n=1 Tax=Arthrobacter sp. YAF17 TaxID=3233077 RepID=UPI003F917BF3
MRDLQDNEAELDEGVSKFPVAKSVRGKIAVIVGVLLVSSVLGIGLSSRVDDRGERDAEVLSLMSGYSVDDVSIYDGSWHGNDGSLPGRYTLNVTKDGSVHVCRQIIVESLRANEPVQCDGGTVIHPRVVPASGTKENPDGDAITP